MTDRINYVEIARRVIRERAEMHENTTPLATAEVQQESLEDVLRGLAIELWSTTSGRLFVVADEADACRAMERLGARRGEVYTCAEARRIIAVKDPAIVAEIHGWKQRFDGVVRELRAGEQLK